QSFGAFIPKGLTLNLEGDANDYFGKGLSGGKLVIHPSTTSNLAAEENIIIGNVALFGATSGEAYINGVAGERFAVRNSGATAVVEGCGDHGLEYMTGGLVAILGPTGRNLAAGMSGGIAFVLDKSHNLYKKVNKELVSMEDITTAHDKELLFRLINNHFKETGSKVAERILSNFDESLSNFKKIIPNDYKKMLEEIAKSEQKGSSHEEAVMEAFKIVTNTASSVA
ncbi:MAG: glutamate synthase subunit alpha, partial [Treponema sp.]|nr:glutamate synthase subunit alpha [Treponema sp.]